MPNRRLCECQCGQPVRSKRRFLPGHTIATAKIWRVADIKTKVRERGITIRYETPNIVSRSEEK